EIGDYKVRIILHPDVDQTISVAVARSAEEAERNAKAAAKAAAKAEEAAEVVDAFEGEAANA
ncbi:MAG TPA: 50S ribosomal protein L9, partial [Alphaproteobacteria bacterium]|nr:50S ribosomal protein L9 [Alphaproteobacteria bacterium]